MSFPPYPLAQLANFLTSVLYPLSSVFYRLIPLVILRIRRVQGSGDVGGGVFFDQFVDGGDDQLLRFLATLQ